MTWERKCHYNLHMKYAFILLIDCEIQETSDAFASVTC